MDGAHQEALDARLQHPHPASLQPPTLHTYQRDKHQQAKRDEWLEVNWKT